MSEVSLPSITPNKNTTPLRDIGIWRHIGIQEESPQWKAIAAFAFKEKVPPPPDLLEAPLTDVCALAYRLQNVSRKVSGEPYFKHVMRTVMLVAQEGMQGASTTADRRVLLSSAMLHDAVELQRKMHRKYGRDELRKDLQECKLGWDDLHRIGEIVMQMTPSKEGAVIPDDTGYLKYKLKDFQSKFKSSDRDAEFVRIIKSADTLANLEETVEDIALGRNDHNMGRSLAVRKNVFEGRIHIIEKMDPANPFLPRLRAEFARFSK